MGFQKDVDFCPCPYEGSWVPYLCLEQLVCRMNCHIPQSSFCNFSWIFVFQLQFFCVFVFNAWKVSTPFYFILLCVLSWLPLLECAQCVVLQPCVLQQSTWTLENKCSQGAELLSLFTPEYSQLTCFLHMQGSQ